MTSKTQTVTLNGYEVDFDACVALMDDDIRERLHSEMAGVATLQQFVDAYCEAHAAAFDGELFDV